MSSKYRPVNLQGVTTYPLQERENKVQCRDFGIPCTSGASFEDFVDSLPHILAGQDFRAVVSVIVEAYKNGRPVIFAMGAHVIKCGLSPFVIDLMRRGVISAVAMNGAGIIHDFEIALIGETSEDVADGLQTGMFGMAEETGKLLNDAIREGAQTDSGLGRAVGNKINAMDLPFREYSILANAAEANIPTTVHVAIGDDIIHMHPSADGAAIGKTSFFDFRLLASIVADLGHGGVYLNVGSAVILPEVFLKALTVARNLGHDVTNFTTVNLDMVQHYRPTQNVVKRPTADGSKGYALTGHHELMIPLIAMAVLEELGEK
jgi:deoxyhypusine synthase